MGALFDVAAKPRRANRFVLSSELAAVCWTYFTDGLHNCHRRFGGCSPKSLPCRHVSKLINDREKKLCIALLFQWHKLFTSGGVRISMIWTPPFKVIVM